MRLFQTRIFRGRRDWLAVFLMCAAMAASGCKTLEQVQPEDKPAEKAAKPQSLSPQAESKPKSPEGLSRTMAKGGKQPVTQRPAAPAAQPASPSGIEGMVIPPETDAPVAANLEETQENNPIDEKAESLATTLGKISSTRAVLVQFNADAKPHYHAYHDEVWYVVKGKAILLIGEDRHVASPGTLFILPRNTTHSLKITGEKPFVVLVIETPPSDPKDVWTPKF